MTYRIQKNTKDIPWTRVADLLAYFGLSDFDAKLHQKTFENSYAVVFVFDNEELIGFGRALSDGVSQAVIYNIALDPKYHGKGLGKEIILQLVNQVEQCNIILYTHPDTISLYEHLGFRRMKTGMALYHKNYIDKLEEMKFI